MTIAPDGMVPERGIQSFQRSQATEIPGRRGDLRFEEGVATGTDVTDDYVQGMGDGYRTAPGRPNHNDPNAFYKHAAQTEQERAHIGSASWIEAPSMLRSFVEGVTEPPVTIPMEVRSGGRYERLSPTVVSE